MRFKYRKLPDLTSPSKTWMSRPLLQVRLLYGGNYQDQLCLIDSGADYCLFNSSIADILGMDWKNGRPQDFYGIAEGAAIKAYMHGIKLQIQGFSESIDVEAGFTDSNEVDGLLGQSGFFDNYRITFERYRGRFEVESRREFMRR